MAYLAVHRAMTREVVGSRLRPDQHSGSLNNRGEECCLCNFIYKWLDFLVFSDKDDKPEVPCHIPWMLIILWDVKEPTHYSYRSRVIPMLCKWRVGEVGHLVRNLEVLLCPLLLGNKSCPAKWTKSNQIRYSVTRYPATTPPMISKRTG